MLDNSIYLLVDDSEESETARRKLGESGIDHTVVSSSGASVPCVKVGNTSYCGRWGIDFLVTGLLGGKNK